MPPTVQPPYRNNNDKILHDWFKFVFINFGDFIWQKLVNRNIVSETTKKCWPRTSCSLSRIHATIAITKHRYACANIWTDTQIYIYSYFWNYCSRRYYSTSWLPIKLALKHLKPLQSPHSPKSNRRKSTSVSQPHTLAKLIPPSRNKSLGTQKSVWKTRSSKANKPHVFSKWSTCI